MKKLIAIFGLMALAACGGDEAAETTEGAEGAVNTSTSADTFVNRDTTLAPVVAPVVTQDTGVVQTTTTVEADTNVDVDTVRRP